MTAPVVCALIVFVAGVIVLLVLRRLSPEGRLLAIIRKVPDDCWSKKETSKGEVQFSAAIGNRCISIMRHVYCPPGICFPITYVYVFDSHGYAPEELAVECVLGPDGEILKGDRRAAVMFRVAEQRCER